MKFFVRFIIFTFMLINTLNAAGRVTMMIAQDLPDYPDHPTRAEINFIVTPLDKNGNRTGDNQTFPTIQQIPENYVKVPEATSNPKKFPTRTVTAYATFDLGQTIFPPGTTQFRVSPENSENYDPSTPYQFSSPDSGTTFIQFVDKNPCDLSETDVLFFPPSDLKVKFVKSCNSTTQLFKLCWKPNPFAIAYLIFKNNQMLKSVKSAENCILIRNQETNIYSVSSVTIGKDGIIISNPISTIISNQ